MAADAVKLGMADRVATLDETIARLQSGRWKSPRGGMAAAWVGDPEVVAWDTITLSSNGAVALEGLVDVTMVNSEPLPDIAAVDMDRRRRRQRLREAAAR